MGTCLGKPEGAGPGGATRSSFHEAADEPTDGIGLSDVQVDGPLTRADINSRIESCPTKTVKMEHCTMRYAYVSQRGYYPDDLHKANQDSYCEQTSFNGDPNMSFFGVFDGHGSKGHLCAQFARDAVQSNLARRINQGEDFDSAFPLSSTDANDQLHKSRIDDSMSGTTYIGVMIKDGVLEVANCGDSRAIVVQADDSTAGGGGGGKKRAEKLKASPLSIDQTPFRKDERERVKKYGCRVMTMDQLDGLEPIHENWGTTLGEEIDESGDPPRIWARDGDYPGTAFTRSIGDAVSERLGVFAEPEMSSQPLTKHDRFIVVASDGVFEFLTSQAVADMVAKFDNPHDACQAVVAEAYQLWLQYEVRTDDITMICIMLSDIKTPDAAPRLGRAMSGATARKATAEAMRPVRSQASRAKRKLIEKAVEADDEEEFIVADHIVPKSSSEMRRMAKAVETNFLFTHLSPQQKKEVFDVMRKVPVTAGYWVIKQGDDGDSFYVVDSGSYEVRVSATTPPPPNGGDQVHQYGPGGHFGELALMYRKPRAASVICSEGGVLWALDRAAFRGILMRSESSVLKRTLRKVEVLKSMNHVQIERLVETLSEVSYRAGQVIIAQGDMGDTFYIITSGAAVCTIRDAESPGGEKEVLQLKQFDYFGERALLTDAPRAATVKAVGPTKCLMIGRAAFEQALGPLESIIDQDRRRRERAASGASSVARAQFAPVREGSAATSLPALRHQSTAMQHDAAESHVQYSIVTRDGGGAEDHEELGLKTVGKRAAVAAGLGDAVANERWLWGTLPQPQPVTVPTLLATCAQPNSLHLLTARPVAGEFLHVLDQLFAKGQPMNGKEAAAKFYVGCAVVALEFLHASNVLLRGVCPELLMIGTNGYLLFSDFRLAKKCSALQRCFTVCGIPTYMPPEQVSQQGQSKPGDWWALGVMLYEMLAGEVPFGQGMSSDLQIYDKITSYTGQLPCPADFTADAKDLLAGLLCPDERARLSAKQVRRHKWFKGFNWSALEKGTLQAPFKPVPLPASGAGVEVAAHLDKAFTGDTSWCEGF